MRAISRLVLITALQFSSFSVTAWSSDEKVMQWLSEQENQDPLVHELAEALRAEQAPEFVGTKFL